MMDGEAPTGTAPEMDAIGALEALLRTRHSCRGYRPDAVPRDVIERILAVAQLTPSWCNTQPWRVHVTGGAATEELREAVLQAARAGAPAPDIAFPQEYLGVYRDRRRVSGLQLYAATGVAAGDREASRRQALENFRFFGAPHVAIVTTEAALGPYGAVDCGAYVTGFMLAAQALGVASIAQASLAMYAPILRARLGIPEGRQVLCGISFGYEDTAHPANAFRTDRAPLAEVVDWHGA
ncbi:nitroreductase [Roseomonas sp. NAR14]|uniref:Nitroreductase n=1 Tax=Roseomonas acroporae TaxID=2937791 RepID=A0A9X1YAU4_9PROT|nr:nitroreductase [Roseomonas acroporae]MCK8787339.1 nitroreductase [Roseomonas acroporae]